jgi:hypothetical protein
MTFVICHKVLTQAQGFPLHRLFGQQRCHLSLTLTVASTSPSTPSVPFSYARFVSYSTPVRCVSAPVDLRCTCMLHRHPPSLVYTTFVIEFFASKYRCRAPLASSSLFFLCVVALSAVTLGSSMHRHTLFQHNLVASVAVSASTTLSTPL